MQKISIPQKPKYVSLGENAGRIEILGCYPGYGTTIGNSLRRIILSSLGGAAISSVKIKGVSHEFSTINGVMEDAVKIILNLKRVRFNVQGDETVKVSLKSKGEGKVTAKDIKCSSGVEVVNKDQIIATITDKKAELELEMEITKGLGYVPIEQQEKENKEIGAISIDAIYTPIKRVNYTVEDMRVGKRTDYNKINLEIETDGSITPQDAFQKAVQILLDQFSVLGDFSEGEEAEEKVEAVEKVEKKKESVEETADPMKMKMAELKNISTRTLNILEKNKIAKIKDILKLSEKEILELEGMGERGVREIKKTIGEFGLTLKQ
jgi:DNA-directed RNA polymerase subunit alpha